MTITATADAAFSPPRVEIDVAVPVGDVMTAVNVWRNDSTGRSLIRAQPSAGFESRTVFDYECPYGQNVTYDWTATYYDPDDNATTFSEAWTTFPGSWTGDTGAGSIATNRLTLTNGSIQRTVSHLWQKITVAYLSGAADGSLYFALSGTAVIYIASLAPGTVQIAAQRNGGFSFTVSDAWASTGPFEITRTATGILVTDGVNTFTATGTFDGSSTTSVFSEVGTTVVGAITAETFAAELDLAETSAAVNLDPADAWLVAPQAPALSFALSNSNQQAAGIRELGSIGNASNTTIHRILGTSTPVTTTTGNRQADELSATVYTHTSEERQALRALLNPDTPILVNVPASWDLDFEYGFYQVGDVTESRLYTLGGVPMRDFVLPLTKVRSPEVDVENPGWSYAQLATTWASYTEVLTNYLTYADLAVDNRS